MIRIDQEQKIFTLHTANTTYQVQATEKGHLNLNYYGPRIENAVLNDHFAGKKYLRSFAPTYWDEDLRTNYSVGEQPMDYSSRGIGDHRINSVELVHSDGSFAFDPQLKSWRVLPGIFRPEGMPAFSDDRGETLELTLADPFSGVEAVLYYGVMEGTDCITRSVVIRNGGAGEISLEKVMSATFHLRDPEWDCLHFFGQHNFERQVAREPMNRGILSFGSTCGSSSHKHNPSFILCRRDATETAGEAYGFALVYSGNFLAECETEELGTVRVNFGIHPEGFCWKLASGEVFHTPQVIMTYSENGISRVSHHFHNAIRKHLSFSKFTHSARPVLLNNWEGTHFDFDGDKIAGIAQEGAKMGADLFVLDDGWFGKRNDDTSGLGDWFVNESKLKGTLKDLIGRINGMGLKFGLWFEPEMISEDSELYRTHPEWALGIPGRPYSRGRKQLLLDFSRPEVQDYIIKTVNEILDTHNIVYVKWDYNRYFSEYFNADLPRERQGEVSHRFILGLYRVMEGIMGTHPDILFEGCSGGGGRFDCGMLYYQPQIWTSDNTDCEDRLKIQYGTSFIYPPCTMGAHVTKAPKSQLGRLAPLHSRAVVAMNGTFGFELDSTHLSEEEKAECKELADLYRQYQPLIFSGDYERLSDAFKNERYNAWQHTAKDRSEALVSAVVKSHLPGGNHAYVCPRGLDETALYSVNGEGAVPGKALMQSGFLLNLARPDLYAIQWYLKKL